jgi:hypothetical protein
MFSVQHGKSHFLLLELESEALPARVALPADKKTSHSVAIFAQTFLFGVVALPYAVGWCHNVQPYVL